jgi:ABC-type transporter Mla subunit MlaD
MTVQDILSDQILLFFLGLLAVYFVLHLGSLVWQGRKLRREILGFIGESSAGSVDEESAVDDEPAGETLNRVWKRYRQTFVEAENKTHEEAGSYFTESAIVGGAFNLRYWKAVPNLLVGIGILGTFVGLTVGISGFETESVNTVRTSIEKLLSGMATAFVSSIVGMAFSIAFNIVEKWQFGRLSHALDRLCNKLDSRFLMGESELRDLEQERRRDVLTDAFGDMLTSVFAYEDNGEQILPAHVLRDLRIESREQTQTLKSFSTDLADGIMMSSLTIEKLGGEVGEAFQQAMERKLTPTMKGVETAVEELRGEKAASNEEMVENVVDRLSNTLDDISDQFQDSLTGGAIDQLEQTASTIAEMGELLNSFQSDFATMSVNLRQSVEAMAERTEEEAEQATTTMRKETEAATKKMREEAGAVAQSMRQESEKAAQGFRSEVEKVTESVGQEIQSLQSTSADLLQRQQASAESVQNLLDDGGDVAGRLKETASSLNETLTQLRQMSESLEEAADRTKDSSEALQTSTNQLKEHQQQWLNAEKETLDELEGALGDMRNLSAEYVQQFETIRTGLEEIFAEIEQGLSNYQNTTRKSVNNYLSDLAENLQTATNAMNGTVTALDESFEEFHEILDKMKSSANGQPQ